jgi:hypothetical protein
VSALQAGLIACCSSDSGCAAILILLFVLNVVI